MTQKSKLNRRLIFWLLLPLISIFLLLGGAEIVLRLSGEKPYKPHPFMIEKMEPENYIIKDSLVGFFYSPGHFKVTFNNDYFFEATHTKQGTRITRPMTSEWAAPKPKLAVFGGSIIYGQSLPDHETFAWLLQDSLKGYEVVNYGLAGAGTIQALIQLEDAIRKGDKPEVALFCYSSYHDKRNTLINEFLKNLVVGGEMMEDIRLPYARMDEAGKLRVMYMPYTYKLWPLVTTLATVNFIETWINKAQAEKVQSHRVSELILDRVKEICDENGIKLVLAGIRQDPKTKGMLTRMTHKGVPGFQMGIEKHHDPEYTLMPFDSHPNGKANRVFADNILRYLEYAGILSDTPTSAFSVPRETYEGLPKEYLKAMVAVLPNELARTSFLREFIAEHADLGLPGTDIDSLYPDWNQLKANDLFSLFEGDKASGQCGSVGYLLEKVYKEMGYKAWSYDIGEKDKKLTHYLTLVEIEWEGKLRTIIQDATFNYTFIDGKGDPIEFQEVLRLLKGQKTELIEFSLGRKNGYSETLLGNWLDPKALIESNPECSDEVKAIVPAVDGRQKLIVQRSFRLMWECSGLGDLYLEMIAANGYPRDYKYLLLIPNEGIRGEGAEDLQFQLENILQAD